MKFNQLVTVAVLTGAVNSRPQIFINPSRSSSKQSIITGSIITGGATLGDPFTLPAGVTLPSGVTLPPGFTIGTDLTRTGTLPGFTFGTPPGTTTTSSSSKSTTSSKSPSSTTSLTTSSSTTSIPSSTTSSTSSSTTSTTKTTSSSSKIPTPPVTQPPTTKTTSSTKTNVPPVTTTSKPAPGTNPYSAQCPIPSTYTVNNFISYDGPGGDVALTITYGDGVFSCPNKAEHTTQTNGRFTLDCDDDGLVRVVTDGVSYIQVQEKFYCDAVPKTPGSYATLQSSANYTLPADALFCETDDIGIRTCLQLDPDIVIPVQTYGAGGPISFNPLDINGNPLPQCSSLYMTQPIVTDTATCTQSIAPTETGKTSTVRFTQTATVTISG